MNIQQYSYEGNGLQRVYENPQWMVALKNWKPENDISGLTCIERHNKTDELFVLLDGECTLLFANEVDGKLVFDAVTMEKNKVYNIERSLWHNTITKPGVKLVVIEAPDTSMDNSDIYDLSEEELANVRNLIK